jgi:hypothetical protein
MELIIAGILGAAVTAAAIKTLPILRPVPVKKKNSHGQKG